jgi:hypothetical protein
MESTTLKSKPKFFRSASQVVEKNSHPKNMKVVGRQFSQLFSFINVPKPNPTPPKNEVVKESNNTSSNTNNSHSQ